MLYTLRRKYRYILVLTLLLVLAVNALALAADSERQRLNLNYDDPQMQEGPSMAGLLLRLVLSLVFIIGLAWITIQVFGRQVARKFQGQWLQVLDEVILGQNRGIILCEIGGKVYALGVTDHQISALFEVEDEKLIEDMLKKGYQDRGGPPATGVAAIWERVSGVVPVRRHTKPGRHFHSLMREQVSKLEDLAFRQKTNSSIKRERSEDNE